MFLMQEKICREGRVLPGNILKVGSFLNQQLDIGFLSECAKEIARLFEDEHITKVITIEASGIALAALTAQALGVSAVIVKKHASANQSKDVYTAEIDSFTHGHTYTAAVAKEYLLAEDRFLIVDDFLACGNALIGLKSIIEQSGATLVGAAIAIEKKFQGGGDMLRASGMRIESLAMIESMTDTSLTFVTPSTL